LDGRKISIKEETNYPFENYFRFIIKTDKPGNFSIKVAKPIWAKSVKASIPFTEENGYLLFNKSWESNNAFELSFEMAKEERMAMNGDIYYEYGPLVLCREIAGFQTVTKRFDKMGFHESTYKSNDSVKLLYSGSSGSTLTLTSVKKEEAKIPFLFVTGMHNPVTGKGERVTLVPMFHTILRQVTFKTNQKQ
jgi:DUF1680 family protein